MCNFISFFNNTYILKLRIDNVMKNKFSLWCQVIWNVFIFVFLLFVFGNLIQRRVVGISVGAEELFFLILIPIFLLINLKPTFVNIKKLYIKYHENLNDETLSYESETNRYAFMNMYQRLSRRRVCLPLIFPLLSITVLTILLPIISKGVLSWKIVFMMFSHLSMQLAFLPSILIPPIISLKIYFSSRHNLDMLRKIYDHLSTQELEQIDCIKEKQVAYVFTKEFLINWDSSLNIVPLDEIKKIEYIRYFYFLLYGTRLKITCNKKYVIWVYGPSEAEWIERGFLPPSKKTGKKVSFNVQLPN